MKQELLKFIREKLSKIQRSSYTLTESEKSQFNFFEEFLKCAHSYYSEPVHSLQDIKKRDNTKLRGDIFEYYALLYFKSDPKGWYTDAWLLEDVPKDILEELGLKRGDLGIDLILRDKAGKYSAVQVKYRTANKYKSKTVVGWKQLSTFYAIALKTGPYAKHIIFTNADYVRHVGKKTELDRSICIGSLRKIDSKRNQNMIAKADAELGVRSPMKGSQTVGSDSAKKLTVEEMRAQRLALFERS
uniref:Mrr-like domain-containing protein n=1 Tax=viral metagenome TaxID=1070528 RepID=A0A6C0CIG7_9ZZZZ